MFQFSFCPIELVVIYPHGPGDVQGNRVQLGELQAPPGASCPAARPLRRTELWAPQSSAGTRLKHVVML